MAVQPEVEHPRKAYGWAARDTSGVLSPFLFSRRREIVGEVTEVGSKVEKFKMNTLLSAFPMAYLLMLLAPLLCAGITVYGPLRYFGLDKPGLHSGVVGLGGLGHPVVKFAKALGLKVTVISTSPNKKEEAIQHLGADSFLVSRDQDQMKLHPPMPLIDLLKSHGKLVAVGAPEKPPELLLPTLILDLIEMAVQPEVEHPRKAYGWAARDTSGVLSPFLFSRRKTGEKDVTFKMNTLLSAFPMAYLLMLSAPLLCAGITVYGPLRYFGLDKPGLHSGVVGLGGSGHLVVKFAKALGLKAAICTLDGIIDTVFAVHPLMPLIDLLKSHGKLVAVGAPEKPPELLLPTLILGRKSVAGSYFGGSKETQEMIDFLREHNIRPEIEVIPMDYVNTAMRETSESRC
ncbi:hypothetical protein ACSQ67_005643 [Phaseolus vulgaris]